MAHHTQGEHFRLLPFVQYVMAPQVLKDALADARETAREAILHGFDERFPELETRIAGRFQESRRELAGRLNQAVRRLRQFDNAAPWSQVLLDAAAPV